MYFRTPFAESGDRTPIANDTQPDGTVSFSEGFGPDYQRDLSADPAAKSIERDRYNELMNQVTAALKVLQEFGGAAPFISASDNGGSAFSYDIGARVRLSGVIYASLASSNTTTPPGALWRLIGQDTFVAPSGTMSMTAAATAADGWLLCQGQLILRSAYPSLFAAIGVLYGAGDGVTTFAVPDMRGMFPRGFDSGRGVDSGRVLGSTQIGTLQAIDTGAGGIVSAGVYAAGNPTTGTAQSSVGLDSVASSAYSANKLAYASPNDYQNVENTTEYGFGAVRPVNIAINFQIKT